MENTQSLFEEEMKDPEFRKLFYEAKRQLSEEIRAENKKISLPNILNNAPLDEKPLTKQEIKESEASWQECQEGKGKYLT